MEILKINDIMELTEQEAKQNAEQNHNYIYDKATDTDKICYQYREYNIYLIYTNRWNLTATAFYNSKLITYHIEANISTKKSEKIGLIEALINAIKTDLISESDIYNFRTYSNYRRIWINLLNIYKYRYNITSYYDNDKNYKYLSEICLSYFENEQDKNTIEKMFTDLKDRHTKLLQNKKYLYNAVIYELKNFECGYSSFCDWKTPILRVLNGTTPTPEQQETIRQAKQDYIKKLKDNY